MNKILTYESYLRGEKFYWNDEYHYHPELRENMDQFEGDITKLWNKDKLSYISFYFCPFCSNRTRETKQKSQVKSIDLFNCDCGWWGLKGDDSSFDFDASTATVIYSGILKSFGIKDRDIPLHYLFKELKKNNYLINKISPYRFEEIAQYVFESYYNCNVELCGKSGDGGIDLLIVESEEPILVQVKNRENVNSTEGVSTVRDFLGAMFINNARKGIIVSTAKKFSGNSLSLSEINY